MEYSDSFEILAAEIRRHLPHHGQIRRLFHGRGGCFDGLDDVVIDAYPPLVIIYLYQQRSELWQQQLACLLETLLVEPAAAIVVQHRYLSDAALRPLSGELPAGGVAEEAGLRYRLRLENARNIGFFPDMAVGRALVRQRAAGKKILNLFAYTCSFSVAALAGGASHVVNLDMNRGALEVGRENHCLNHLDSRSASFLAMEFFKSQSRLRKLGPFDLVICDPPATQGKSFNARQHWPKLLRRCAELVTPGGELLACMNGPVTPNLWLDTLLAEHLPEAVISQRLTPGVDFPEGNGYGETAIRLLHFQG